MKIYLNHTTTERGTSATEAMSWHRAGDTVQILTYDENGAELADITIHPEHKGHELDEKECEARYLRSWRYNTARILDELETIVLNNGGAIVSTWRTERKYYAITNFTLTEAIREESDLHNRIKERGRTIPTDRAAKLEKWESIDNTPHITPYGDFQYICFVLDGIYYNYNMTDNPFFDATYSKIPVVDGKINPCHYSNTDKKEWLYDCFLSVDCSQADRREAANIIFNMMINDRTSTPYKRNRQPEKLIVLAGNEEALTNGN